MAVRSVTHEIAENAYEGIKKNHPSATLDDVKWIIDRYIHYMKLALINGHEINLSGFNHTIMRASLKYKFVHKIGRKDRLRYMVSNRMFGHLFCLDVNMFYTDKKDYVFYPDKEFKVKFEEVLNTDQVFKYVRR